MIDEIKQWAITVMRDATERGLSYQAIQLIQMELADLQGILAKYEEKGEPNA